MRLSGKVALITGAGSGIGRETALLFASEGAKVVVADVNAEAGERTVSQVKGAGGRAVAVRADVSKGKEAEAMIAAAEREFGRLDVLMNNAGISHIDDNGAVDTEEAVWDLTMAINVRGVFLGCKYGIHALRRAGGGSIINISSTAGLVGAPGFTAAYTATKGAVRLFTKSTAVQHAKEGIRCNSVHPGPIATDMIKDVLENKAQWEERLKRLPMGRVGTPEDVAYGVIFLASDESSFMTGSELVIDGGTTAE
jgi:NAD(P)-dependent dehydrogenase (short-subunit alcohol dehydrogenase family)